MSTAQLGLCAFALECQLAHRFELASQLPDLRKEVPLSLLCSEELLLRRHGRGLIRRDLPVSAPKCIRLDQLRLREPCAGLLEQVALMRRLRAHVVPNGPAHRKLLVHEALDAHLTKVFDSRLALLLELLFHLLTLLVLEAKAFSHGVARLDELLPDFIVFCLECRKLRSTAIELRRSLLLGSHHALRFELALPVHEPVRVGVHQLRLCDSHSRLLEQIALPDIVGPQAMPRSPATSKALVHEALETHVS